MRKKENSLFLPGVQGILFMNRMEAGSPPALLWGQPSKPAPAEHAFQERGSLRKKTGCSAYGNGTFRVATPLT